MSGHVFLGLEETPSGPPVSDGSDAHLITVARPGTGKSRSVAMVNLITMSGSAVVSDFKGELAAETSLWRETMLRQNVVVFDPFHIVPDMRLPRRNSTGGGRGRLNPIDYIRKARSPLTAAYRVAEALIPPGGLREAHWADSAQNRLVATLLFVALDAWMDHENVREEGMRRDMAAVWKLLSVPVWEKAGIVMMLQSETAFIADQASAFHKVSKSNTEIQSIRNHLRTNLTKTLSEPKILETLNETNVDFSTMNSKPQTVYICLPGDDATTHFRYTRLISSLAFSELRSSGLRSFDSPQPPTYFLWDEFATLGNFPLIVESMGRDRGAGFRHHVFVQNLSQLNALYGPDMNTILGNGGIFQYFGGTNDVFTAEYISKLCGTGTIIKSGPTHTTRPGGDSESESAAGRPVFTPDEIMRLELPLQIIKVTGKNPVLAGIFDPSLAHFPDYLAFMECIDQGMDAGFAAEWARKVPPIVSSGRMVIPSPPQIKKPVKRVAKEVGGPLHWLLAKALGHETE